MSKRGYWRWRSRSVWLWVLVLCCLLLSAPSVLAQQPTEPGPQSWPPDSMQLLPLLIGLGTKVQNLQERLVERNLQIASLKADLLQLEQQGQKWSEAYATLLESLSLAEQEQENLRKELQAISSSRARLQEEFLELQRSFNGYQTEASGQISEIKKERDSAVLQARLWRVVAIGGITLTVTAVVVIVVVLVRK